jgi:hypothetical protein
VHSIHRSNARSFPDQDTLSLQPRQNCCCIYPKGKNMVCHKIPLLSFTHGCSVALLTPLNARTMCPRRKPIKRSRKTYQVGK